MDTPQHPRVLIVEDDPEIASALAMLLRDWGARVDHAENGAQVDQIVRQRGQELRWIITDFHLGDSEDGVSLVRRHSHLAPDARVLVLTGSFHGRSSRTAAQSAGFEMMQKPARAAAIVEWLERA